MSIRPFLTTLALGSAWAAGCSWIPGDTSSRKYDGGTPSPVARDTAVADTGAPPPVCIPASDRVVTSLASGLVNPYAIAVSGSGIYFESGVSIFSVALAGGSAVILATGQTGLGGMTVDRDNIYWTSWATLDATADPSLDRVMAMPLTGGEAVALVAGTHRPQDVAVDATHAYWTAGGASDGVIMSVPLGGGTPATLASGQVFPGSIALDQDFVYWVNGTTTLAPPQEPAALMKVPKTGGLPVRLATAPTTAMVSRIALDSSSVYWTLNGLLGSAHIGTVTRVPLDGSAPILLASDQSSPGDIAVDSEAIYWANSNGCMGESGSIQKLPLAGGAPIALACDQFCPMGLAADATHVYWTDAYVGAVMTTTKD
jgi:hypothetical protein